MWSLSESRQALLSKYPESCNVSLLALPPPAPIGHRLFHGSLQKSPDYRQLSPSHLPSVPNRAAWMTLVKPGVSLWHCLAQNRLMTSILFRVESECLWCSSGPSIGHLVLSPLWVTPWCSFPYLFAPAILVSLLVLRHAKHASSSESFFLSF